MLLIEIWFSDFLKISFCLWFIFYQMINIKYGETCSVFVVLWVWLRVINVFFKLLYIGYFAGFNIAITFLHNMQHKMQFNEKIIKIRCKKRAYRLVVVCASFKFRTFFLFFLRYWNMQFFVFFGCSFFCSWIENPLTFNWNLNNMYLYLIVVQFF